MSEQQFVLKFDTQENEYFIRDNSEEEEELGSYTLKWGVKKLNEQQSIIFALKKENKELKGKLDDILELTEFVGMTSLRKAEIKSIVNR